MYLFQKNVNYMVSKHGRVQASSPARPPRPPRPTATTATDLLLPLSPSFVPPSEEEEEEGCGRWLQNRPRNCPKGLKDTPYNSTICHLTAFKTSETRSIFDDGEDTQLVAKCSTNWYISTQLDSIPALTCDDFEENECWDNEDLE